MPFLDFPVGAVVVVPGGGIAWVGVVHDQDGAGTLVSASNEAVLADEAAAFMRSFGPTDLDGGFMRICPPEVAAKAIFPEDTGRPW
ncbi:MAG TPA: hypothetical protein VGP82_05260 [Ktedonobacterales bacterium]|jgi:hypothetical protein|nr:hypothetical protein [Ktedonobacterales bacterium]